MPLRALVIVRRCGALPLCALVLAVAASVAGCGSSPDGSEGGQPTEDAAARAGASGQSGQGGQGADHGGSQGRNDAGAMGGVREAGSLAGGQGGRRDGGAPGTGGQTGRAGAGGGRAGNGDGGARAGGHGGGGLANGGTRGGAGAAGSSGGRSGQGGRSGTAGTFTVFIAGDSTVMTYVGSTIHQAGWGQYLQAHFDNAVKVDNRAIGGRTSRRFIEEDRLTTLLAASHPGDYLLVQFGTNDSNKTATYDDGEPYYLAAATDFKTWMQKYVTDSQARGVHCVFVTPPPRNSCQSAGMTFAYSLSAYATAMQELGDAAQIPVVDLGRATVAFLDAKKDCGWASQNFFLIRADGTVDGTHFQENGASIMAGLVAEGLAADAALGAHLK